MTNPAERPEERCKNERCENYGRLFSEHPLHNASGTMSHPMWVPLCVVRRQGQAMTERPEEREYLIQNTTLQSWVRELGAYKRMASDRITELEAEVKELREREPTFEEKVRDAKPMGKADIDAMRIDLTDEEAAAFEEGLRDPMKDRIGALEAEVKELREEKEEAEAMAEAYLARIRELSS